MDKFLKGDLVIYDINHPLNGGRIPSYFKGILTVTKVENGLVYIKEVENLPFIDARFKLLIRHKLTMLFYG